MRLLLSSKFRLRIYLAIMVIALVLTRARMGNVAFFTALGLAGSLALFSARRFSPKVAAFLASLFFVDMIILGRWFGFDKLIERLEETNPTAEGRLWSNEYALDYLADFPLTGSGGGSFFSVFPNYQTADFPGFHLHAHNDYLEFALELGIVAAAALIAVVALALWSAYRVQRERNTRFYKAVGFTVTMTVLWAAIHSLTDFNLQIPANALTFLVILALAFIVRDLPGKPRRASDR